MPAVLVLATFCACSHSVEPNTSASDGPALVFKAEAEYPKAARIERMEGTVSVRVYVEADGSVSDAQIISGVHPLIDRESIKASLKCRFEPAGGSDQGTRITSLAYVFDLDGG